LRRWVLAHRRAGGIQSWVKLFHPSSARWQNLPLVWFLIPLSIYLVGAKQPPHQIEKQLSRGLEKLLVGATPDNVLIWRINMGLVEICC